MISLSKKALPLLEQRKGEITLLAEGNITIRLHTFELKLCGGSYEKIS